MRRLALAVVLSLMGAHAGAADGPSATATAAKAEVGVGEPFAVDVKVAGPAGTSWTFPTEAGDDNVELRTPPADPKAPPSAAPPDTHRYLAAAFALGDVEVPAIAVKYRLPDGTSGEVATTAVKLKVVSTLPKDPGQQQLVDIREPQPLAAGAVFWLACATGVLLIAGLVAWLVRRRRRPVATGPVAEPERAADAEAREALDRLAASGLLARGEYRPYYIALAEIAKRYLERRLGAPVLEMTSTETVAFLRDHTHGHGLAGPMRDLAAAADQVKFARGMAPREEAERHAAVARQMIDALEARLRPAAASSTAAVPPAPGDKVA
jgi:hypothetical protein